MAWQNNWSAMQPQGMGPRYPPPMSNVQSVSQPSAPMPNYAASNTDQYNQWQWQQYQQQYAQWYAMYGEKYAQQTGNTLPPVASPMPPVPSPMPTQAMPNAMPNPYIAAPLPVGPAIGSMNMVAPPPPSEPHPDELNMNRTGVKPPLPEEKSPEEVAFDEQFRKWEQEFETWKKTNVNHPDKAAYREYEQKYEEQRKKLLDHREQLRRRRIGQNAATPGPRSAIPVASVHKPPPPPQASQPPPPPPQPALPPQPTQSPSHPAKPAQPEPSSYGSNIESGNVSEENTQKDRDDAANDMHLQNLFSAPGKGCRDGGIPGLDLIDDAPPPLPKKAKLEDPVIDLSNDEEDVKRNATKTAPNNMISSLLNDPNVNALLQLVGKTMSGNSAGASGVTNPLVAALAQLTNNTNSSNLNPEKSNSVERQTNELIEESAQHHSNAPRSLVGSHTNGPSDRGSFPSSSTAPHCRPVSEERSLPNNPQEFDPRIPPPLLDVDFTRPPPMIRSTNKSLRDRFGRNSEPSSENGPFNDGYGRDGSPLAKMPRFDSRPPLAVVNHKEYEMDPELGRPVAVPKPDWMTEEEYQEIYDRYEHVQIFENRKSKMLLAIQVLKQKKIRTGTLVLDEPNQGVAGMPKPLPPIKEPIKSEPVDDYFKPQQVFDYSNCRNVGAVTSHQMPAGRVIDYGHCAANQQSSTNNNRFNNNRRDDFRDMDRVGNHSREVNENGFGTNTQRFDYNHSRVANAGPVAAVQQGKNWPLTNHPAAHDRTATGLERLAQMHLNPNPEESNPNYPSKFLLMNDNRPNCLSTKRGKRPSSIRKQKLKQMQQQEEQQPNESNEAPSNAANAATGQQQVVCKQEPDLLLEDLSSDDETLPDGGFAYQSNDESAKPIKQEPVDERSESTVSSLSSQHQTPSRMVDIDDLLLPPGRFQRPPRICFLIRGLPGSGKSHLARLIKNTEQRFNQSPRVLSIDDYFLIEREEEEKDPMTGKISKLTKSEYEYDAEMEDIYVQNLIKAFKRTISERLFNFVIVDCCNHMLETYCEFHNYARSNGFKVYTCTMQTDVEDCARQNIHNRTEQEIQIYADNWAMAPDEHVQLNFSSLLKPELPEDADTTVADMELAAADEEHPIAEENRAQTEHTNTSHDESNDSSADGTAECDMFASKWDHDTSEQNLARLDGISKPLKRPPTLEDYLQLDDINSEEHENQHHQDGTSSGGKKKRVRWADIEERKAQEKMRQLGFVVGVTDWKRMMDPSEGSSALTQTKYIARVKRQP
uniref:YLP motif-containing protein 1 n=1 Tax=Anopheles funestus TaxID=62324 RepID=A0A182RD96_ANOFN